jgi:hypothetical protein
MCYSTSIQNPDLSVTSSAAICQDRVSAILLLLSVRSASIVLEWPSVALTFVTSFVFFSLFVEKLKSENTDTHRGDDLISIVERLQFQDRYLR